MACLPLAWLLPHHYLPWLSAQHEFLALALACLGGLLSTGTSGLPRLWALCIGTALLSVAGQLASGVLHFSGDAVMVALYLVSFGGAMTIGSTLGAASLGRNWSALDLLAVGTVVASIASVALALMQWTSVFSLPLPVVAVATGDRPYANLAQTNHFCTASFLGLCAIGWLYEARRIGRAGLYVAGAFLLLGMVMSGSRTAWLQLGCVALAQLAHRHHSTPETRPRDVVLAIGFFASLSLGWPWINQVTLLAGFRVGGEPVQSDLRWPLWQLMFDAIGSRPWSGFGWQQVASAQIAVALDHQALQRLFEHSHNLIIDLMVWAGVPVGGLIALLGAAALARQWRAIRDPRSVWLLIGVMGVLAHSMLEYPMEYGYFLMPVGIAIGAMHSLDQGQLSWRIPRSALRIGWVGLAALLTVVATDYLRAEQNYREVRLRSVFRSEDVDPGPPELRVLSQLQAYLAFIRTQAGPGMSEHQLQGFRDVATRFPHPPVMLRVALAEGLNGHPDQARKWLLRICAMHLSARCDEARESWRALQEKYPVLVPISMSVTPAH